MAEPPPGDPASEQAPQLAHVVGRFVLSNGGPASGATVQLRGWPSNDDEVRKYGAPKDWTDPTGVTDADGRFDLELDPPRAYQFILDANYPGHAEISWRWHHLPKSEVTDVGEQTFVPTGVVVGRVKQTDGSSTRDSWRVYADTSYRPTGAGADETRVSTQADPETGEFRLEGLPAGSATLKAHSRMANWIDGPVVQVRPNEEVSADIVYDGPDLSRTITVVTFCRPFFVFNTPDEGRIVCVDAVGNEREVTKIEGSSQSHAVGDLDPGSYTIRVESPLHAPWSRSGVTPGQRINANLSGNAAAKLRVVSAETGERVEGYGVDLRFEDANFSPNVFTVLALDGDPPAGGVFGGLIPRDSTLIVRAPEYAPCEVSLAGLEVGETRAVTASLEREAKVRVAVLDGAGKPGAGAKVHLHPHRAGYDPDDVFSWPGSMSGNSRFESRSRRGVADEAGRLTLDGLAAGDYDLRVSLGAVSVVREHLILEGGVDEQIEVRMPGSGAIAGQLLFPPEMAFDGLSIWVYPTRLHDVTNPYFREAKEAVEAELDADGRFLAEGLNAEEHIVELRLRPTSLPSSSSSSSATQPGEVELGRVAVVPGTVTRREFDVTDLAPGFIELEVTLNGAPAAGLVVFAKRSERANHQNAGGMLDTNGRLRLGPLFEGDWSVQLYQLDSPWRHAVPGSLRVSKGKAAPLRVDLVTARGRVRLLHQDSGEPLAQQQVRVNGRSVPGTDAEGWLELELLPGDYEIVDAAASFFRPESGSANLTWTAGGPAQDELELPLVEDGE